MEKANRPSSAAIFCHRVIPLPASLPTSPPPHQSRDDPLCPRQSRSQSSPSPRLLRLLPWIVPINGSATSRVRARRHIRRSRWQLPFPASMLFSDASSHTIAARSPPHAPHPNPPLWPFWTGSRSWSHPVDIPYCTKISSTPRYVLLSFPLWISSSP